MKKKRLNHKKYFKLLEEIEDQRWTRISILEKDMAKESGVEDIEFFFVDGYCAGIGNASRTMKLINI